jgi:sarcosine oxidase subunit beta
MNDRDRDLARAIRPTEGPPKRTTELAIVGGGVMGLGIAYQLSKRGFKDIVVLERGYLAQGASGRNGGGVRMQWSTEQNVRLMQESIELCRGFAQEIGVNVWFRQGGYLFLAKHQREVAIMQRNVETQNRCGVPTRMLEPAEAGQLVPELDIKKIVCACYNPKDGVLFPWPFLWGYAHQALKRGVEVHLFCGVQSIERDGSGFRLQTQKGPLHARRVINAAGAWSPEIARMLGVELPNKPHRHEILSTEPLKPFLTPMVSVLSSGLYFSQSMRGEIVTGISVDDHAQGIQMGSRLKFLTTLAREMVSLVPRFADLKVLRQWAGPYDVSPDGHPILGEPPGVPGFFLACGFVGHGFMMAPIISKLYAEWLIGGAKHEVFDRCRLQRFAEGKIEKESMILG